MEIVNLGGVEREHKTHNITFHYPNLPLQKGAPLQSLPRSCFGQKRASLNALFSHRGVIRTRDMMAFPGQPWVIELEDCRVLKLRCNNLVAAGPSGYIRTDRCSSTICPNYLLPKIYNLMQQHSSLFHARRYLWWFEIRAATRDVPNELGVLMED